MTPTEQKAFDQMRDTFKPFEKLFKQMTDVHPTPTNFDCQIAVRDLRALIYSFDDLTAANAVSDHFRGATKMIQPLGWYVVNKDGMATLCADYEDAQDTAASSFVAYPHNGPYRTVQLCEYNHPQATEPQVQGEAYISVSDLLSMRKDGIGSDNTKPKHSLWLGFNQALDAAIDYALHYPAHPQATEPAWRPIETAPKDGSEILAFNGENALMHWIEVHSYAAWEYADETLCEICPEADQPTHWMPLPAAPEAKQ